MTDQRTTVPQSGVQLAVGMAYDTAAYLLSNVHIFVGRKFSVAPYNCYYGLPDDNFFGGPIMDYLHRFRTKDENGQLLQIY